MVLHHSKGAHDTGGGGAICMVETKLTLIDSLFEDNVATDPPGTDNAIFRNNSLAHWFGPELFGY